MKKTLLALLLFLLLTGCSSTMHQYPDTIAAEELATIKQKGDKDGEKYVLFGYDSFYAFSLPESDSKYKTRKYPLIPKEKRLEAVEAANIPDYARELLEDDGDPYCTLKSVLTIVPTSKTEGLSTGDEVTYEVAVINTYSYNFQWDSAIALEQVEEILGVKFIPSVYIVE